MNGRAIPARRADRAGANEVNRPFVVKLTSPGLDPDGRLQASLPKDVVLVDYDDTRALKEQVGAASVLLTRSVPITAAVIDAAPNLRLIQRVGAHVEAIDIEHASARGIPVCNIRGPETGHAVAEHALFLMLALAKRAAESQQDLV